MATEDATARLAAMFASTEELMAYAQSTWKACAMAAAPLGALAVYEYLMSQGTTLGVDVRNIVTATNRFDPYKIEVAVNYINRETFGSMYGTYVFDVRSPNVEHADYATTATWIGWQQEETTDPKHNVNEFIYGKIIELVRKVTKYTVAKGDLWAHVHDTIEEAKRQPLHEGLVSFGSVTDCGTIALQKYKEATS